jgi:hypothetical protein
MFANTLTLTINAIAKTLVRVNQDNFGSTYKYTSDTEIITLQFRNSVEKAVAGAVDRHNMFIEHIVFATPDATEKYYSFSATLRARRGSSPTALGYLATAAAALLSANQAGLIAGES